MFPRFLFLPHFLYFRKSVVKKLRVIISHDVPFPLYFFFFFSVLCNSPLSGLNPYSDVQAVIYAPVRARWELTQTPSFMFGLFFAIFCFCFSLSIFFERTESLTLRGKVC